MKAVVLCAGFGTRLTPITYRIPKPLVPVANRPVLDIVLDRIAASGIEEVGINLHHMADTIARHLETRAGGIAVRTVVEPEILETGGGIAHFRDWDEPLLVHNVDVVTDIDIGRIIEAHRLSDADVTMAVVDDARFNAVRVTPDGRVVGIRGDGPEPRYTLAGIYALSRRFVQRLEPNRKHSVIEAMVAQMSEAPGSVRAIVQPPDTYWRDLGHVATYLDIHRDVLGGHAPPLPGVAVPPRGLLVGDGATIDPAARLDGFVAIGPSCTIGPDVRLTDCVVLSGTHVAERFSATRAVLLGDLVVAA